MLIVGAAKVRPRLGKIDSVTNNDSNIPAFFILFPAVITNIKGIDRLISCKVCKTKIWLKMWKANSPELREKAVLWRKQNALTRIDKPSRIARARRLGYKAKQGIIVVRMRVGAGGMRKKTTNRWKETKASWCN